MHICHLSTVHERYDTRIFRKECRSLVDKGYKVSLVVADDLPSERIDGVEIYSVGKPSGRLSRILKFTDYICHAALQIDADVFHFHDPELLLIAKKIKKAGKKVVYDIHEETAKQIRVKPYLGYLGGEILSRLFCAYERNVLSDIDAIVAATDGIYREYANRGVKISLVPNYVDLQLFKERHLSFDRPILFHPGGLTKARGLVNMIELAKKIKPWGDVLLAGPLSNEFSKNDLLPAHYLGVLSESRLLEIYSKSNIGLILYNPEGQYGGATAIKLYEFMAACMPLIMPNHGDWPSLNTEVACGINVPVNDADAVADAVQWIVNNPAKALEMGWRGRKYVERKRSWSESKYNLYRLYDSLFT